VIEILSSEGNLSSISETLTPYTKLLFCERYFISTSEHMTLEVRKADTDGKAALLL
jgi:hypothetical protein